MPLQRCIFMFFFCAFFSILSLAPGAPRAFAYRVTWEIDPCKVTDPALADVVTANMEKGLIPVGMTFSGGAGYIFYADDPFFAADRWELVPYKTAKAFKAGLTEKMNADWTATALSYDKKRRTFYVFYINSKNAMDGWRTEVSAISGDALKKGISEWFHQDYFPVGLTVYKNQFVTLLAHFPDTSAERWRLAPVAFTAKALKKDINDSIGKNMLPTGLVEFKKDFNIMYAEFTPPGEGAEESPNAVAAQSGASPKQDEASAGPSEPVKESAPEEKGWEAPLSEQEMDNIMSDYFME